MAAARLLPAAPSDRQRIDRYELVGEIASGGMATVYLARRAGVGGFQRFVAVKRLHPHLANEDEFVQMFLDEARLAALIHHPNVVSITEVGASDRGYYLVMDYIEGDTLARLMTDSAEVGRVVPLGVGLRIVIDMLTGLHAAHELRDELGHPTELVHRDVSPQNVLVGIDGISRLSDFGVARAASRLAGTRVGQLKGKIAYMAPEQAAGDEQLDRRADVFAAGIVLWELLTGRRLFRASNDAATLSRVVGEKIDPPTRYVEGLDLWISDVCMKALERPLSRRIPTAAQFAELLESASLRAGLLGTGRDVSAYLQGALGEEITRQQEAVRRWVNESDSLDSSVDSRPVRRGASNPPRYESVPVGSDPAASSARTRVVTPPRPAEQTDLTLVARPKGPMVVIATLAVVTILVLSGVGYWRGQRGQMSEAAASLRAMRPMVVPAAIALKALATEQGALQQLSTSRLVTVLGPGQNQPESASQTTGDARDKGMLGRPNRPMLPGGNGRQPGSGAVDLTNPYR